MRHPKIVFRTENQAISRFDFRPFHRDNSNRNSCPIKIFQQIIRIVWQSFLCISTHYTVPHVTAPVTPRIYEIDSSGCSESYYCQATINRPILRSSVLSTSPSYSVKLHWIVAVSYWPASYTTRYPSPLGSAVCITPCIHRVRDFTPLPGVSFPFPHQRRDTGSTIGSFHEYLALGWGIARPPYYEQDPLPSQWPFSFFFLFKRPSSVQGLSF